MISKEEYLKQVEARLPKFDSDIVMLRARINATHNVEMIDCNKQVDRLCTKYTILRLRLQVLKESEDERWERHRLQIERAIRDLSSAIDNVGTWVWVRTAE